MARKYNPGDKVGPYNVLILSDQPPARTKSGRSVRVCEFQCPFCEEQKSFITRLDSVVQGRTKSCGCLHKKQASELCKQNCQNQMLKLIGKQFGHLVVLEMKSQHQSGKHALCRCKCLACGNENYWTTTDRLVSSKGNLSCGCQWTTNLEGQQFGKLIVIEKTSERDSAGSIIYRCECSCGNKDVYYSSNRLTGITATHCNKCAKILSKGENKISSLLFELKINYETQKTFNNCINLETGSKLRFDFYLPDYNICIEYDGIQHFEETTWTHDSFIEIQKRDRIKNDYCKQNNIVLKRIPYKDFEKISKEYILDLLNI